jgi:hypothetical protein
MGNSLSGLQTYWEFSNSIAVARQRNVNDELGA